MNAQEHCKRVYALKYTPYVRKNGKGYRLIDGELIPGNEFQAANKLPVRLGIVKANPCKKHQYLDVEGSVIENLEKLIA